MKRPISRQPEQERELVSAWQNGRLSAGAITVYLQWIRRFREYCEHERLNWLDELTFAGAQRFTRAYVGPRKGGSVAHKSCGVAWRALRAWSCTLQLIRTPVPEWRLKRVPPQLPPLLTEYCRYRRSHCGVAEVTLGQDVRIAKAFLASVRGSGRNIGSAKTADIDTFVSHLSGEVSTRTLGGICSTLRSFLRFLQTTGRLRHDLASSVMAPRVRFAERPPRALPWDDVRHIIQTISKEHPPGKRDAAMLLLMATYGLGAAEVLGLCLEDVDWNAGLLRIRRPKTGAAIELPLLTPAARALVAYLREERPPHAQARRVFLGRRMPYRPITSGAIRHRIRLYAQRAGITRKVIGAHSFRHSHASRQIDAGANVKVVSDILGHRRPSSTSVYVRVALRRLRLVCLPVPR